MVTRRCVNQNRMWAPPHYSGEKVPNSHSAMEMRSDSLGQADSMALCLSAHCFTLKMTVVLGAKAVLAPCQPQVKEIPGTGHV